MEYKRDKIEKTYIEKLCEVFVNSLVILSFIKIIIFEFNITNYINLIIYLIIIMVLLLINTVDTILRMCISLFSLYIFYFKEIKDLMLISSILTLLIIYSVLYFLTRVIIFHKKVEIEIISNWLALSLTIKLLYSYFYIVLKMTNYNNILYFLILLIILLLIPILEDITRLLISILGSIDILIFIRNYISLSTLFIILISLLIYVNIQYKFKIKKSY